MPPACPTRRVCAARFTEEETEARSGEWSKALRRSESELRVTFRSKARSVTPRCVKAQTARFQAVFPRENFTVRCPKSLHRRLESRSCLRRRVRCAGLGGPRVTRLPGPLGMGHRARAAQCNVVSAHGGDRWQPAGAAAPPRGPFAVRRAARPCVQGKSAHAWVPGSAVLLSAGSRPHGLLPSSLTFLVCKMGYWQRPRSPAERIPEPAKGALDPKMLGEKRARAERPLRQRLRPPPLPRDPPPGTGVRARRPRPRPSPFPASQSCGGSARTARARGHQGPGTRLPTYRNRVPHTGPATPTPHAAAAAARVRDPPACAPLGAHHVTPAPRVRNPGSARPGFAHHSVPGARRPVPPPAVPNQSRSPAPRGAGATGCGGAVGGACRAGKPRPAPPARGCTRRLLTRRGSGLRAGVSRVSAEGPSQGSCVGRGVTGTFASSWLQFSAVVI